MQNKIKITKENQKDFNTQLSYLRHSKIVNQQSKNNKIKICQIKKKEDNYLKRNSQKISSMFQKQKNISLRYMHTRYKPSPIINPQVYSPKIKKQLNISQYRKIIYDYEGTINKQQQNKQRTLRKAVSNIFNMHIQSQKLGIQQNKLSTRKINKNRSLSSIKFG